MVPSERPLSQHFLDRRRPSGRRFAFRRLACRRGVSIAVRNNAQSDLRVRWPARAGLSRTEAPPYGRLALFAHSDSWRLETPVRPSQLRLSRRAVRATPGRTRRRSRRAFCRGPRHPVSFWCVIGLITMLCSKTGLRVLTGERMDPIAFEHQSSEPFELECVRRCAPLVSPLGGSRGGARGDRAAGRHAAPGARRHHDLESTGLLPKAVRHAPLGHRGVRVGLCFWKESKPEMRAVRSSYSACPVSGGAPASRCSRSPIQDGRIVSRIAMRATGRSLSGNAGAP